MCRVKIPGKTCIVVCRSSFFRMPPSGAGRIFSRLQYNSGDRFEISCSEDVFLLCSEARNLEEIRPAAFPSSLPRLFLPAPSLFLVSRAFGFVCLFWRGVPARIFFW
ncbi:hypothetical protein CEXT_614611 [Caerostris extrusa]|uniref:Uncharacterized protein n=1 Tax=Caerostris extrusa TaxID=172846 RepID=A0AAV4VN13_CAEEX|nr:hypothetical protein CEXT_614611 [Caerostris extrusa]